MRKVVLVFALALCVTGVTASGAIAQESNNSTTTTMNGTQANSGSVIKIDNTVTVTNYRFEDNTLIVTLDADYSQLIVISDMFVDGNGAQQIPRKRMTLDTGKNTIRFDVTAWKGTQGASISTAGGAIAISEETGGFTFTSEFTPTQLAAIAIVSVLTGVGLVLALALKREYQYTSEVTQEL
jgi:hypothetical protein